MSTCRLLQLSRRWRGNAASRSAASASHLCNSGAATDGVTRPASSFPSTLAAASIVSARLCRGAATQAGLGNHCA